MINLKQKELIDELFGKLKAEYPEITFLDTTPGSEDPADIWLNVLAPMEEGREMELNHLAAELSTDILINFGYSIGLNSKNPLLHKVYRKYAN